MKTNVFIKTQEETIKNIERCLEELEAVKKVMPSFDGKVPNKKLIEALPSNGFKLSKSEHTEYDSKGHVVGYPISGWMDKRSILLEGNYYSIEFYICYIYVMTRKDEKGTERVDAQKTIEAIINEMARLEGNKKEYQTTIAEIDDKEKQLKELLLKIEEISKNMTCSSRYFLTSKYKNNLASLRYRE